MGRTRRGLARRRALRELGDRLRPIRLKLAVASAFSAGVLFVGAKVGRVPFLEADVGQASDALPSLPVLPVVPAEFDGVPLQAYLSAPAVSERQLDELLVSPVLADPEFARAVHAWIDYWAVAAVRWFPGFLVRMGRRGPAVDSALAANGLPPSLRYLPLIESGYDPGVTSRSGAVGLWQLMPTTARELGLDVSLLVDERRHPEKSTRAAMEYLTDLQAEFGSWFLVLAAYNSGPTRVRAILRRHAPDEPRTDSLFWALRQRFPAETRDFVPKLYGAMWVASRPEAYGY